MAYSVPRAFKELGDEIVDLLSSICNLSLNSASMPEDRKVANVTPVFKKASRGGPRNYRVVNLTSVPGKFMENVIRDRTIEHNGEQSLLREVLS